MHPVAEQLNELMKPLVQRVLALGYSDFRWHCMVTTIHQMSFGFGAYAHQPAKCTYLSGHGKTPEEAAEALDDEINRLPAVGPAAHAALGREMGLNPDGSLMEEYRQHG